MIIHQNGILILRNKPIWHNQRLCHAKIMKKWQLFSAISLFIPLFLQPLKAAQAAQCTARKRSEKDS